MHTVKFVPNIGFQLFDTDGNLIKLGDIGMIIDDDWLNKQELKSRYAPKREDYKTEEDYHKAWELYHEREKTHPDTTVLVTIKLRCKFGGVVEEK